MCPKVLCRKYVRLKCVCLKHVRLKNVAVPCHHPLSFGWRGIRTHSLGSPNALASLHLNQGLKETHLDKCFETLCLNQCDQIRPNFAIWATFYKVGGNFAQFFVYLLR